MKPTWLLLPILLCAFCACAPTQTLATPTRPVPAIATAASPTATSAPATLTSLPILTNTATPAPTKAGAFTIPFVTDTPQPGAALTAAVPTATLWSAAGKFLSIRHPTLPELGAYLKAEFPDQSVLFDWQHLTPMVEDLNGDDQPDMIGRDPKALLTVVTVIYTDVNADGQVDLVTYSEHGLVVLLWSSDRYQQPFALLTEVPFFYGPPENTVTFADWTGDGQPEIVYDSTNVVVHGTGIFGTSTTRYLFQCRVDTCQSIWQNELSLAITDYNSGGISRRQLDMRPYVRQGGLPSIRAVDHGFSIYCCMPFDGPPNSLYVMTSTLAIHPWTGEIFGPAEEQVINRAARIAARATLSATNAQGVVASVAAENNHWADGNNDVCQLTVAGQTVGGLFGCRGNFTTVEWKDLTGDGIPDIVITAYSSLRPSDRAGNQLSDDDCMHQRLLAYQWDGQKATAIANVAGCVIREDLYGVRLADVDGDGKLEIEAAPNGTLQNRAYKWNGKQFVF